MEMLQETNKSNSLVASFTGLLLDIIVGPMELMIKHDEM